MAGVWSDDGIKAELDAMLAASPMLTAKLRLFQSNTVPSNASVLADFTECTFPGYSPVTLSSWSAAAVAGHIASAGAATATFTITSGTQQVYGWYATDSSGAKLLWSQRDPSAPITLDAAGLNVYSVTITLRDKDTAT